MSVKADEYLDKLVEYCMLKLYAVASVKETNQTWADEDDFQVLKPKIDIRVSMHYYRFVVLTMCIPTTL